MKAQVGQRIRSARMLAGLSLRELSHSLEGIVSHNAIAKYENGEMMPDAKVLNALSRVLGVDTGYFLRPQTVEISHIEFRKKSSLSQKKVNSIKEQIRDNIERYIELESFLNIPGSFRNPIKDLVIRKPEDVETAVERLLHVWDLGSNCLPNVVEMLEDKEVKVVEIDEDDQFDGLSGWANETIPVIVINKNFSVERKRFTALHELGHLLLNTKESAFSPKETEKICHRFAGAMLLPKATLVAELGVKRNSVSINELVSIKESYGISIQAIMARAKDLAIIREDRYISFRMWVGQSENRKKEIGFGEYRGSEHSSRFRQLLYRATAEEIISMSKAASLCNIKLAEFREEFMAL